LSDLLLLPICLCVIAGCGKKPVVAEPPGFADLPPVPRGWGSDDPEVQKWREPLKGVYQALGPEAHWKLKQEHKVDFRLRDLPPASRDVLIEYLKQAGVRDWVESKVGRPPDLGRLGLRFEGSPGSTVTLALIDPADPDSDNRFHDIGAWPSEKGDQ
jgi:hypothetical protein